MIKKFTFFFNSILASLIIFNIVSYKRGCTNFYDVSDETKQDISGNYIISNINSRIEKITSDRLTKNNIDSSSLKKWYLDCSESWFNKSSKKLEFINNLEEKIKYKARKSSIQDFNDLEKNKDSFKDFNDLQTQLDNTALSKNQKVNINFEKLFEKTNTLIENINKIKNKILKFYNIISKLYGKNNVLKLVYKINYKRIINNDITAAAITIANFFMMNKNWNSFLTNRQMITLSRKVFTEKEANNLYIQGFWSSKSIIHVFVHEYGHALSNFLSLDAMGRKNINNFDYENINSDKLLQKYRKNNYNRLFTEDLLKNPTEYMITSLAKDTEINHPIYQKLLSYAIVRSNYGRTKDSELFAEGFTQWIETQEDQRNIAWEKLDQFFRIDLPKISSLTDW